jgi:excisionase family DNA binding protein
MKMVQSNFGFKEYNSAMKKLIAQFDKSQYEQIEILEWENDFVDINSARSSADRIVKNLYYGRIVTVTRKGRLFLRKKDMTEWDYKENQPKDEPKNVQFVGVKECCEITGLSEYFIRNAIRDGLIPVLRTGKKYLIDMDKLTEKMDEMCITFKTSKGGEQ